MFSFPSIQQQLIKSLLFLLGTISPWEVMYCGGVFPGDLVDETDGYDGYDGSNDLEASLIVSRCRVTLESSARFGTYLGTSEHKRA